jgi:HEAT repeat protein
VAQDTEARAAIIARLQDPEDDVRAAAIRALAELIAQDAEARAALLAELQDPSWNVRVAATGALAPLVTQHNEVRAAILARLQDPDNDVRAAAIHALARLLAQDAEARTLVYAKLEGPGDDVCAAISALGRLVTEDAHARAAVLAKLEDPNGLVRAAAIDALAGLIPQHVPLRRAVFAKLDDPDDSVRAAATAALDSLVAQDGDVQAAVFAKLQDRSWEVRSAAAHSIAPYLEQYPDSLSALMPLLSADDRAGGMRRQDKTARQALVQALGGLVSTNAELRNSLVQALCSEDWRLRQSAAEVFAAAEGIDLQGIAPFLLAATDEHRGLDSWRARIAAAEILINDRQFSADALETLLPALDYGTHLLAPVRIAGYVRRRAAVALGKLKAEFRSPALFSRLERLLQEDPDPGVLDAAFDALLSLAAAPEPA